MKHYYQVDFIVGNKFLFDGEKDLTQGLLIQPSTYPILVVTNVAKRPTLDIMTKAFNEKFLTKGIRSDQYIAIPTNNGEKVTSKEGEWWLSRTPALVLNIEQEVVTNPRRKKAASKK